MNITLLLKSLRMQWKTIFAFALGSLIYSFAVLVAFGRFVRIHQDFFAEHFGKDSATVQGFVANWYLGVFWVAILAIFVSFSSSAAVAREREEGTLGLVLTYPISRSGFLLSKLAATTVGLAIIIAATLAGLWAGGLSQHLELPAGSYWAVAMVGMALGLAILGIGSLLSVSASRQIAAAWAVLGVVFILYALHLAAQGQGPLRQLGSIDIFGYFDPAAALGRGRVGIETLALLAVAVITTGLAATLFRLKDFRA